MYLSQEKSMGRSKVNICCNREVINACIVRHNHTFSYAIKFLIIRKGELISNVILVSLKNENQSGERLKPYSYTFHIGKCIGDSSNNSTCSQIWRAFRSNEGCSINKYINILTHTYKATQPFSGVYTTIPVVDGCSSLSLVSFLKGKEGKVHWWQPQPLLLLVQLRYKVKLGVVAMVGVYFLWFYFDCTYYVALGDNFKAKAWKNL